MTDKEPLAVSGGFNPLVPTQKFGPEEQVGGTGAEERVGIDIHRH
jgi:hypothetical protein